VDPVHVTIVYFQQEILCEAGPCLRNVSLLIDLLREGESEGPPQRPNYEARPLSENATTGRHGPAFEHGYGKAPSLTMRRSSTDSGVITQSTLVGIGEARLSQRAPPAQSSQLSSLAHSFVGLGLGNNSASADFISKNPRILAKSEIDALIAEASIAEKAGEPARAQTCIYQALLLKECLKFPNHIGSFFSKLTAKDGRAKDAFVGDVEKVYAEIQEQIEKTTQRNLGNTSEFYDRKGPVISQSAERTNLRNVSVNDQIPLGTTQSQTLVARGPNERSLYANQRGNLLQPASGRHDPDHHRSFRGPVETTEREGTQGGKAISGRGNVPGRAGSIHRPGPNNPTKRLPTLHEHRQPGSNKPGGNERSAEKLDERKFSASAWSYVRAGSYEEVTKISRGYRIRLDAKRFFEHGRVSFLLYRMLLPTLSA
jgi:hypothetical protein